MEKAMKLVTIWANIRVCYPMGIFKMYGVGEV